MKQINNVWYYFGDDGQMYTNYTVEIDGKLYFFGENGTLKQEESIATDGWKKMPDGWYYVQSGNLLKDEWLTLNGHTYYFDYSGRMYANTELWIYDSEGQSFYYRFDKNGYMITGWYYDEEWYSWYYYNSDGRAASGMKQINNVWYYFVDNGQMQPNYTVEIEGKLYYFGDNGQLQKTMDITTDGWKKMPNGWYYVQSGRLLKGEWLTLGGHTYYFDGSGRMYANASIGLYDDMEVNVFYYRFDENGYMVTGWYCDEEWDSWYYYESDGRAASGMKQINNVWYYFDYEGQMQTNHTEEIEGKLYYFGDNGQLEKTVDITTDGWKKMPDGWYYVQSGRLLKGEWLTLGGHTYYFDGSGQMYANGCIGDYDDTEGREFYYRFDENGYMVTGWYEEEYSWYYYESDGRSASGMKQINNVWYYFHYDGRMQTNHTEEIEGKLYYFGDNGQLQKTMDITTDGWKGMPDGWYYARSGSLLKGEWLTLGGHTYYFNYDGRMRADDWFWISDDEGREFCYRFDKNGYMITGWYQDADAWYYYGNKGYAVEGLQAIDGKYYYCDFEGRITTNKKFFADGKIYEADANGVCTLTKNGWIANQYYVENGVAVTGWKKLSGSWYYFSPENGKKIDECVETIGNHDYYFDNDGIMKTGWIQTSYGDWYYADSSGVLARDEWRTIGGKKYYFNGSEMVKGVVTVDDQYQLFDKNGVWIKSLASQKDGWFSVGSDWYYKTSGKILMDETKVINGKTYGFDYDGKMLVNTLSRYFDSEDYHYYYFGNDGAAVVNQWKKGSSYRWMYFDENGKSIANGWEKIDGAWYYFSDNTMIQEDRVIDGKLYHFASNGASNGVGKNLTNGWNLIDGQYYYYQNGKLLEDQWLTIGSKKYYLGYNGEMLFNSIYEEDGDYYYFDKNGAMTTGWCNDGYHTYYAGTDGKLLDGFQTISGKQYYFQYHRLWTSDTIADDGKSLYIINANGVIIDIVKPEANGWKKTGSGDWYYVKGGKFVTGHQVIGGKQYYFDDNGVMATNACVYGYDSNAYADGNGVLQFDGFFDGVYIINGEYEYEGPRNIDGKMYYFYNERVDAGVYRADGAYYLYDGKGGRTKVSLKEGWNQFGSDWYYAVNGELCTGMEEINGRYYYFNYNGKMRKNTWIYAERDINMYLDENGQPVKGWKVINGKKYYFDANGRALSGVHVIDGVKYILSLPYIN